MKTRRQFCTSIAPMGLAVTLGSVGCSRLRKKYDDSSLDQRPYTIQPSLEAIHYSGPHERRYNIAIMDDGYRLSQKEKFLADARRATSYVFGVEPFAGCKSAMNVFAAFVPSRESGITDPYHSVDRDTVLDTTYYTNGTERHISVRNHKNYNLILESVPHDIALVITNSRRYGGGAIYNKEATAAIDSESSRYLVIHELAHAIGGLADEYYIPSEAGPVYDSSLGEPQYPNITANTDMETLKWGKHLSSPTQVPQDWEKSSYDSYFRGYVDRYFALREQRVSEDIIDQFILAETEAGWSLLKMSGNIHRAGLYKGAGGFAKGLFRSEPDCIMFTLQTDYFCKVCSEVLERTIRLRYS